MTKTLTQQKRDSTLAMSHQLERYRRLVERGKVRSQQIKRRGAWLTRPDEERADVWSAPPSGGGPLRIVSNCATLSTRCSCSRQVYNHNLLMSHRGNSSPPSACLPFTWASIIINSRLERTRTQLRAAKRSALCSRMLVVNTKKKIK